METITKAFPGDVPTYTKPSTVIIAVAPTVPTLETLATFNLTAVAPESPVDPVITSDGVATVPMTQGVNYDISGVRPEYNGGAVIGFSSAFAALATKTVTDLSVSAVPPDTPDEVVEAFGSVPSYVPPEVGGTVEELTNTIGTGNSQTDVSDWFENIRTYMQSLDEDMKKKYKTPDRNWIQGWILKKSA